MLPMIRSEFRKLTTVRGPWLLLAAGPAIVVAGICGLVVSGADLHSPATVRQALAHTGLAAIFTLVFGILAVAGEYRHSSITDTFLGFPSRGRVAAAKLTVCLLVGAAAGLACSVTALAATAAAWAAKGASLPLSAGGAWLTLGGGVAANAAFAAIGAGLGALIRNLMGAVAAALAWVVLGEGIAGQLLGQGLARWLPFYASEALDRSSLQETAQLLPQWGGGLMLLAYAALFTTAAAVTTLRRDVT
jgi:ABC-2 type transport system permease protein